jgi:hypothetical protein
MRKLLAAGENAVACIARHLRPAPVIDTTRIPALIADLDSNQFALREQASSQLAKLGEAAESALQSTLKGSPTPESRRRVDALLANIYTPSGERLQALRAIELLERLATPAARKALRVLAEGAAGASTTKDAITSLRRLDHR